VGHIDCGDDMPTDRVSLLEEIQRLRSAVALVEKLGRDNAAELRRQLEMERRAYEQLEQEYHQKLERLERAEAKLAIGVTWVTPPKDGGR